MNRRLTRRGVAGALLIAPDWRSALVLLVLVLAGGWLFWKLIRALARIQMPERPRAG